MVCAEGIQAFFAKRIIPDKYIKPAPGMKREPIAPVGTLLFTYLSTILVSAGVFAACFAYFSMISTSITTISYELLPGKNCEVLIPKVGLESFSQSTSEGGQFASFRMGYDQCISYLREMAVCGDGNRLDFISLVGVINANNSQYYANGMYSFTPTETAGQTTKLGVFYPDPPPTSFPLPLIDQTPFVGDRSTFHYMSLADDSSLAVYENYDKSKILYDESKDVFYDKSRAATTTGLMKPVDLLGLQAAVGSFKLMDLAAHDGVYYGLGTEALFGSPRDVAVDAQNNVYVADSSHRIVRKIDGTSGVVTSIGMPFVQQ